MTWWKVALAGAASGVVAAAAMSLYQAATASAFGQDGGGEPSNEKAADSAATLATGGPLTPATRKPAGSLVHYATGAALGIGYAGLVAAVPRAGAGFGLPYGAAAAVLLDDLAVPALGWGEWPDVTDVKANAYTLSAHLVFGAALEGGRRLVEGALD